MDEAGRTDHYDVLVVGGGINGAAIARDAAGRGLRVLLCERDDLGQHTSSASSKLIHGGLRYLEHYQFGLVRKALRERETLMRSAPHIIRPLHFVMPHDAGQRPALLIRLGLYLYDHLAPREILPSSQAVRLRGHAAGVPLRAQFRRGFMYADGWVDDARLVVLNAIDARERGAQVLTRTGCSAVQRHDEHWQASLHGPDGTRQVRARALVNAAGPWAAQFLGAALGTPAGQSLRLIKGSHIVVPRLFDHPFAYIFQHPDRRVVFAMPFEEDFTLIGTTDVDFHGDPAQAAISGAETDYLCQLVNRYFARQLRPSDVLWSYAGVRPLVEDAAGSAAAATRDYRLLFDTRGAPLLTVFGGKITTSRLLAEQALDWLAPRLGVTAPAWTGATCLPGGDVAGPRPNNNAVVQFGDWVARRQLRYGWLPPGLVARYARSYGSRLDIMLRGRKSIADMGAAVCEGLYEVELEYLASQEWARCGVDVLWRRSKLGLHLPPGAAMRIDAWFGARRDSQAAVPAG